MLGCLESRVCGLWRAVGEGQIEACSVLESRLACIGADRLLLGEQV
jgi:hypothetical protein